MTGANAWFGERYQLDTGLAVADLNARGGVLGQSVELIVGADACDPDQTVALARKLASDRVVFTGFDPWQWYVWTGGDYEPAPNLAD